MTSPRDTDRQGRAALARQHAAADLRRARALIGASDALANAAAAQPEPTNKLRRAVAEYRQRRKEANDAARDDW